MAEEGEDLVVNLNAEPEVEAKVEAKPPPVPGPPAAVEPQVGLQICSNRSPTSGARGRRWRRRLAALRLSVIRPSGMPKRLNSVAGPTTRPT